MFARPPILVVTCGNPLSGDDAFGPMLAELLHQQPLRDVEVVDLGINPAALTDLLERRLALIIADAATCPGTAPGELIECDWQSPGRPMLVHERSLSTHGLSITEQVELSRSLGLLPAIVRLIALTIAESQIFSHPGEIVVRQLAPARQHIELIARSVVTRSLTELWYG